MQITHEQAHRLIQFHADQSLTDMEKDLLDKHLHACQECSQYAGSIQELESNLRPMMQRRWNQQPLPRPTVRLVRSQKSKITEDILLATRIAAMCVICMAVLINIWQFTQSSAQEPGGPSVSVSVPPVPTPSLQTTSTTVTMQECRQILYPVQEGDTLEGIASQFSITKQEITSINELGTNQILTTSIVLKIPLCNSTPAGTPRTVTTLFTPLTNTTTTTPVGRPTQ